MRPAIVGVNQTPYACRHGRWSLEELIYRTARDLLKSARIDLDDIDHVAIGSSDGLDGRSISCMVTGGSVGDHGKDLINSSSSGEHALLLACLRILSGRSRLALVVNWAKPSEAPLAQVDVTQLEPFYHRGVRVERTAFLAMQAQAYTHRHRVDPMAAAKVVEKNRANAGLNPLASRRAPVPAAAAASSEPVAWPLRAADLPPQDDGAVALLVAEEETARRMADSYAIVSGFGWSTESYWAGERDLAELTSVSQAAAAAYRRAGICDPRRELDVIEVMDVTPYHELMAYEALGVAGPGRGPALMEAGVTLRGGELPANPSGGLQGANPDFAAGLSRVAEAALQVSGKAGERQVEGVRTAVAQTIAGFAAQTASVFVLSRSQ
ncbi:MAG: thiolase family protein [bacterium]